MIFLQQQLKLWTIQLVIILRAYILSVFFVAFIEPNSLHIANYKKIKIYFCFVVGGASLFGGVSYSFESDGFISPNYSYLRVPSCVYFYCLGSIWNHIIIFQKYLILEMPVIMLY